jgi:hypothetical protein
VSFDLYAFPTPGPATLPEVHRLIETDEPKDRWFDSDAGTWLPPPGPEMAVFMGELEDRWISMDDDDTDSSPWSSWPLWQPVAGGGTALNIRYSYAASMMPAILEIAAHTNVIIYDPQTNRLIQPGAAR